MDVNTRDVSKNVVRAKDPQASLKASFRDVRVKSTRVKKFLVETERIE